MAKKLSKAQERELERIRERYNRVLARELEDFQKDVDEQEWTRSSLPREYFEGNLARVKEGYVLWNSPNSRTLEILAEHNLIEYIKNDEVRFSPIDWVKLL